MTNSGDCISKLNDTKIKIAQILKESFWERVITIIEKPLYDSSMEGIEKILS